MVSASFVNILPSHFLIEVKLQALLVETLRLKGETTCFFGSQVSALISNSLEIYSENLEKNFPWDLISCSSSELN